MKRALAVAIAFSLSFAACGDDELSPEQMRRNEARCVKDLVAQAEHLDGQVRGFEKWNQLAAEQRNCVEEGAKATLDSLGD